MLHIHEQTQVHTQYERNQIITIILLKILVFTNYNYKINETMSTFKSLNTKKYIKAGTKATPDSIYWKKFSVSIKIKLISFQIT